jgi:hypothetical protein
LRSNPEKIKTGLLPRLRGDRPKGLLAMTAAPWFFIKAPWELPNLVDLLKHADEDVI